MLDIQTLETWLWDAACTIRGPVEGLHPAPSSSRTKMPPGTTTISPRAATRKSCSWRKPVILLREAEEERAEADRKLAEVLQKLGLGG